MSNTFYVIFPGGDKNKLSVLELKLTDDVDGYALASRHSFFTWDEAEKYMIVLGNTYGKSYQILDERGKLQDFLD